MTCTSTGDTQILKGRTGAVSVRPPDSHKGLFEPSKHLWQVQGLILNMISCPPPPPTVLLGLLICPWTWGIFFGGIQHSPSTIIQQVAILEFSQEKMSALLLFCHLTNNPLYSLWGRKQSVQLGNFHLRIYIEGKLNIWTPLVVGGELPLEIRIIQKQL